jgi:hypothetical protein
MSRNISAAHGHPNEVRFLFLFFECQVKFQHLSHAKDKVRAHKTKRAVRSRPILPDVAPVGQGADWGGKRAAYPIGRRTGWAVRRIDSLVFSEILCVGLALVCPGRSFIFTHCTDFILADSAHTSRAVPRSLSTWDPATILDCAKLRSDMIRL